MADVLHGNGQSNQLNARADKSQLYGLQGNDTLTSDGKNDVLLVGGSGDDSLIMTGGNGTLSGGDGSDTFELNYSATETLSAVIEDLNPSEDKIVVNFDGNTAPQLTSSIRGSDVVWRDGNGNFNFTLKGVRENDYFDGEASDEAWEVLRLTNVEREAQRLSPLTMADGLTNAAQIRAEEISTLGESGVLTDHTRPDGSQWSTVLDGKYNFPGENLDGGATSPEQVISDWMNSTAHRANILNTTYKKLGVGYNYYDIDKSDQRYYWTQLFADRLNTSETVTTANLLTANPAVDTVSKFITLTEDDDIRSNSEYGATIAALGGYDSITNNGLIVSISGGNDNDTVDNRASFATISAGTGNDSINLHAAQEVLIQYASGDGNDTISGFNATDTLSITGDEYTPATVGNNIVVAVGDGSINLAGAANLASVNIDGTRSKVFILTEGDDTLENTIEAATIAALGGKDFIDNHGDNVSINGGAGDDSIDNYFLSGSSVTIDGGIGNDFIDNLLGNSSKINGGDDNDTIHNSNSEYVTIDGGAGDDSINDSGDFTEINGGDDNDTIHNSNSEYVTIDGGDGNDSIYSWASSNLTINAGAGDDSIHSSGSSVTIDGGDGDDSISNDGDNVTIDGGDGDDSISGNGIINGGAGNDTILNNGTDSTVLGGADNDYIILLVGIPSENQLIQYTAGDGSDTVENFNENSILSIEGAEYFAYKDGNDIVVDIDTDSIRLLDAATLEVVKINDETLEFGGGEESKGKAIILSEDPDTLENTLEGATIQALGGNDSLTNTAANVLIDAGMDDDQISLSGSATNNLIQYNSGDGNDTVTGFNDTATLEVYVRDDYSTQTSGNDVLVNVDTDSITLKDAANLSALNIVVNWSYPRSVNNLITLSENHDNCSGEFGGATLEALGGNDSINNSDSDSATIDLGAGNDFVHNSSSKSVSINGGDGNDSIENYWDSDSSTLYGGAGNDSIYNWDSHSLTINGGTGDDTIGNRDGENILFVYNAGDGNDIIEGFDETSTLSIAGGTYSSEVSGNGNDLIITVGDGSIILRDAATLSVNINNEKVIENIENDKDSILIESTDGDNNIKNSGSNVTINAGAGDDTIDNRGSSVTIDAGAGDDSIYSWDNSNISINGGDDNDTINSWASDNLTILGGDGDDSIHSSGSSVTIDGGIGDDFIYSSAENNVSINAGDGKDTIDSSGDSVTIDAGTGDDSIRNWGANATINGGADNDYIYSNGINNTILGGDGDDTIDNNDVLATISGGAGNDSINNVFSDSVSIDCGVGNDTIYNASNEVTINGGTGDDFIENGLIGHWNEEIADYEYSRYKDILYKYSVGDGNDTIVGFDRTSTLNILEETSLVSSVVSGDDVIIKVGDGSITLKDYRNKPIHIIIGESGLSGGSSNDNSSSNSNSSSGGGGRGGNDGGGRTSGGTSSNEGRGSDASGGRSASGSSGSQTSTGISSGSGRVSSNRKNATTSAASRNLYNEMTTTNQPTQTNTAAAQNFYVGGNQVIANYQSGDKIIFGAQYTGAFYDGAGNFFAGSSTGALVVKNALDKVIDLSDAAGNDFVKAYAATTAGLIDGRGIAGFELINGSAGADAIYAGDGGSQLWGGADVATDILVGGNGADVFIGGRTQGADLIVNASSADTVHLNDASLSDIIATEENNGVVAVAFNTGNVVAVQSSELLSAKFLLADGSAYRFNHAAKNWQSA